MIGNRCAVAAAVAMISAVACAEAAPSAAAPMRDFIGTNIHVGAIFQNGHNDDAPAYFRPAVGLVRDYHPLSWNLTDTAGGTNYPRDRWNWIDWSTAYGQWTAAGYRVNPAIQFADADLTWTDLAGGAAAYGEAFAAALGPAQGSGVVESVQIGNEPGDVPDEKFKAVFQAMSAGIRAADPTLPIVTPNVRVGSSGPYHKSLSLFTDLTSAFDVISINTYAAVEGYPSWERTFPESADPRLEQLKEIQDIIAWRDEHAPGKQIWITEFGYDSTTKTNHAEGTFKGWKGVTDQQQAQWMVRSYLLFSSLSVDRAYQFWFNDQDSPTVHGSSGLTRSANAADPYQPKPSFWAIAHLQEALGDYRFETVVRQDEEVYVYAYRSVEDASQVIWAIWSPTGSDAQTQVTLTGLGGLAYWAERMPLAAGDPPLVPFELVDGGVRLMAGESPTYLWINVPEPRLAGVAAFAAGCLLTVRSHRILGNNPR